MENNYISDCNNQLFMKQTSNVITVGPYRLTKTLGTGSFGKVKRKLALIYELNFDLQLELMTKRRKKLLSKLLVKAPSKNRVVN